MADKNSKEKKTGSTGETTEVPTKSKKKLIIGIVIVLLLILIGTGGFLYYKKSHAHKTETTEEIDGETENKKGTKKEPVKVAYESLDKFVTNLSAVDPDGKPLERYIQVQFVFQLIDDDEMAEKTKIIKELMPSIKHEILMILTEYDDKTLLATSGKLKLMDNLKTSLNDYFKKEIKSVEYKIKSNVIDEVLITDFIVQ